MPVLNENDAAIRKVLDEAVTIAMVGASDDPYYASFEIARYLRGQGYIVYPVNPTIDEADGHPTYDTLADVPAPIDIVNVFRKSDYLPDIMDDAAAVGAKTVWAQLGVVDIDGDATRRALEAGLNVATDLCIRTEHQRLGIDARHTEDE